MNDDAEHAATAAALITGIADRLRRERERAQLSASELARRAGLAKSTLTQLEAGQGNPGVETLWALAVALGVPFAQLIAEPAPVTQIVRAGEGPTTRAEQTDFAATLLASCPPGPRHSLYRLTLGAGASRHSAPHIPGTVEHLTVTAGRMNAGPADAPVDLATGDYMRFPGDIAHVYTAVTEPAHAVLVMAYP
ncbi:helix-turn-helix domain-containing protein [Salinisphaera orenii]|uniref:HTH cro/C1-type domain-containing protein n=1 Tax=Salinisphaera orenii YIM 95161 TaxID=1051139 RepID=A0A423Q304_9GAMM|nr:XRE family transcriptional regulator [Salinisphaera halophila]ROO32999.1 hypothetical protein SAHL_04260 [Salinisphaera halophila YIM 95161]